MNELIKIETMTSVQIAEVTGKRHADVLRDIRNLVEQLDNEGKRNFALADYRDEQGKKRPMFELTKKGCLCLASGYDANLRMKIINRWEELEIKERQQFQLPTTFAEALRLAAEQAEQIEAQQKLIEVQKPKAEYFDGLIERGNNLCFRDTAKLLGIGEKAFIFMLIDNKYIYRDAKGRLKPIAKYVGKYFVLKEWNGEAKAGTQTLITVEGRERFKELINEIRNNK